MLIPDKESNFISQNEGYEENKIVNEHHNGLYNNEGSEGVALEEIQDEKEALDADKDETDKWLYVKYFTPFTKLTKEFKMLKMLKKEERALVNFAWTEDIEGENYLISGKWRIAHIFNKPEIWAAVLIKRAYI